MSYWIPGGVSPHECAADGMEPRLVYSVYGESEKVTTGITLAGFLGESLIRVTTMNAPFTSQDEYDFATFLLGNEGVTTHHSTTTAIALSSQEITATVLESPTLSCAFARTAVGENLFITAPTPLSDPVLSIRPVTEWGEYDIDLTLPQPASALSKNLGRLNR